MWNIKKMHFVELLISLGEYVTEKYHPKDT